MKHKVTKLRRERGKLTRLFGDFNAPLSIMDRISRRPTRKRRPEQHYQQLDLTGIQRTLNPKQQNT